MKSWRILSILSICACVAALFGGCGYTMKDIYRKQYSTVFVPVIENKTLYRGYEFDLTEAVIAGVKGRTSYRMVSSPKDADLVISGEIMKYSTPGVVGDISDKVIVSSVNVTFRVTVKDRRGEVVFDGTRTEYAPYTGAKGESEGSAFAEVAEKLSRWVVTCLEEPW